MTQNSNRVLCTEYCCTLQRLFLNWTELGLLEMQLGALSVYVHHALEVIQFPPILDACVVSVTNESVADSFHVSLRLFRCEYLRADSTDAAGEPHDNGSYFARSNTRGAMNICLFNK